MYLHPNKKCVQLTHIHNYIHPSLSCHLCTHHSKHGLFNNVNKREQSIQPCGWLFHATSTKFLYLLLLQSCYACCTEIFYKDSTIPIFVKLPTQKLNVCFCQPNSVLLGDMHHVEKSDQIVTCWHKRWTRSKRSCTMIAGFLIPRFV